MMAGPTDLARSVSTVSTVSAKESTKVTVSVSRHRDAADPQPGTAPRLFGSAVATAAAPDALAKQRPPSDSIERDRVFSIVQARLLGADTSYKIGRFVVEERVGAGAMGVVYRAKDPKLDRQVALKLLHPAVDSSSGERSRIVREAKGLAQIQHPNVVTIYDIGTHEGRTFVAMELIEGATLTEWLAAEPRHFTDVVRVMSAAGRGLEAVHGGGLVHRDLKPDNILIDGRGVPRIADFGLVKPATDEHGGLDYNPKDPAQDVALTATGALMGTPAYMAPEQFARGAADAHSDQFAYGATFYEALYGARPYEGPPPSASSRAFRQAARWLHRPRRLGCRGASTPWWSGRSAPPHRTAIRT
jgi:serine/threonine protein kinase